MDTRIENVKRERYMSLIQDMDEFPEFEGNWCNNNNKCKEVLNDGK